MIINVENGEITASARVDIRPGDIITIEGDYEDRPWWKFWQPRRLKRHRVLPEG